jgi:hypothetical protein
MCSNSRLIWLQWRPVLLYMYDIITPRHAIVCISMKSTRRYPAWTTPCLQRPSHLRRFLSLGLAPQASRTAQGYCVKYKVFLRQGPGGDVCVSRTALHNRQPPSVAFPQINHWPWRPYRTHRSRSARQNKASSHPQPEIKKPGPVTRDRGRPSPPSLKCKTKGPC